VSELRVGNDVKGSGDG